MAIKSIHPPAYLASSAACIAAIGALSNQKTARLGNTLGLIGVGGGLTAALGSLGPSLPLLAQMGAAGGAGALVGQQIAARIKITDLPQVIYYY